MTHTLVKSRAVTLITAKDRHIPDVARRCGTRVSSFGLKGVLPGGACIMGIMSSNPAISLVQAGKKFDLNKNMS